MARGQMSVSAQTIELKSDSGARVFTKVGAWVNMFKAGAHGRQ